MFQNLFLDFYRNKSQDVFLVGFFKYQLLFEFLSYVENYLKLRLFVSI